MQSLSCSYIMPFVTKPKTRGAKPKDAVIRIRVTTEQKHAFERAAVASGLDVSGWLRMLALTAVRRGVTG